MKFSVIFCNRSFALINCLIYLFFLVLFSFWSQDQINNNLQLHLAFETWKNLKVFLITFCSIGLFFSGLLIFATLSINKEQFLKFKKQFVFLSLISLNIFLIPINSGYYFYESNKNKKIEINTSQHWWTKLGFRKWTIFDIALIGVFTALVVLGNWFEMTVHFLPFGAGGLNIKYMFVMIIAFLGSVVSGFVTGAIGALISLIFIGGDLILSPWSYLLDYFLPMVSPCVVGFFYFSKTEENKKLEYLNYVLMIVFSYLLIWFWQTLSGYLIWVKMFAPTWGTEWNGFVYSLVFNALSIWVFSYPITQILLPIIIRSLRPLSWKR